MTWNAQQTAYASEPDLAERYRLYVQVLNWWAHLPDRMRNDINLTMQTSSLRFVGKFTFC